MEPLSVDNYAAFDSDNEINMESPTLRLLNDPPNDTNFELDKTDDFRKTTSSSFELYDFDKFFSQVYDFYLDRGFWPRLVSQLTFILFFLFVVCVSFVAVYCIDYSVFFGQSNNKPLFGLFRKPSPFGFVVYGFLSFFIVCYLLYFILYGSLKTLLQTRKYFSSFLSIENDEQIQETEWKDIVDLIVKASDGIICNSAYENITPLDVMTFIMRKENYLNGFIENHVVKIGLPILHLDGLTEAYLFLYKYLILSDVAVGNNYMYKDRDKWVRNMKLKFVFAGFASLLALPFVFFLLFIFKMVKGFRDSKADSQSSGRKWTKLVRWRNRLYNESSEVFSIRMAKATNKAQEYLSLFNPNQIITLLSSAFSFLCTFLLIFIIILSLFNPMPIFGISQVSIIAILGSIVAIFHFKTTTAPQLKSKQEIFSELLDIFQDLPFTAEDAHKFSTKKALEKMFPSAILLYCTELLSVLLVPLILFIQLPIQADKIAEFLFRNTQYKPNTWDPSFVPSLQREKYFRSIREFNRLYGEDVWQFSENELE